MLHTIGVVTLILAFLAKDAHGHFRLTPAQQRGFESRSVQANLNKWPNGRVPYVLVDSQKPISAQAQQGVKDAIASFNNKTCIRFVPRTNEPNYISFVNAGPGLCWSYVGVSGGRQELSIGSGCQPKEIVEHEMMHAIGFFHEQQRPDRDAFINVLYGNIETGFHDQYTIYSWAQTDNMAKTYGYDLMSLMHYASYDAAIGGRNAMEPKAPNQGLVNQMGRSKDFTSCDAAKINFLYNCKNYPSDAKACRK